MRGQKVAEGPEARQPVARLVGLVYGPKATDNTEVEQFSMALNDAEV